MSRYPSNAQPGNDVAPELPAGVPLATGEHPLVGERFRLGTVVFYLQAQLVLTNRRLYAARPNTLLGLIPAGTSRTNFPIENVAGVSASTRFNLLGFVAGALAALLGFWTLSNSANTAGGVSWIVIGLLILLAAPRQAIEVMNSGGGTVRFPVSVFERNKAIGFANRVSEAVARRPEPPAHGSRSPSPADASDGLRHLASLRDDGLITDAEFAAKRAELLARL